MNLRPERRAWPALGARASAASVALLSLFVATATVAAQEVDFDIDVARLGMGSRFGPFFVERTEPLSDALRDNKVQKDTRLLVSHHPAGRVAFLTDQLTYHHVAQGNIVGEAWMVSF